jgi:hypothetical protein
MAAMARDNAVVITHTPTQHTLCRIELPQGYRIGVWDSLPHNAAQRYLDNVARAFANGKGLPSWEVETKWEETPRITKVAGIDAHAWWRRRRRNK